MKIHFKVPYFTKWGERIFVSGNIPELGNNQLKYALPLSFQAHEDWVGQITSPKADSVIKYKYVFYSEATGLYLEEAGDERLVDIQKFGSDIENIYCFDKWNSFEALDNIFLTSPFKNVFYKHDEYRLKKSATKFTHIFKVKAPTIENDEVICIIGDCKELGNWSINKVVLLEKTKEDSWEVQLNLAKSIRNIHYKYGVFNRNSGQFVCFESGNDRTAAIIPTKNAAFLISDDFVRIKKTPFRGAGISIPVFSIRTKKSFGVGDFSDIKTMIDWACKTGFKLLQVLPLNDTIGTNTEADVLPYAAISAFALHPLYLNLNAIGKLPDKHPLQKEYEEKQALFNSYPLLAYLDIVNFKLKYAKEIFSLEKKKFLETKKFKEYFKENEYWLVPYAAYCVLRDKNKTSDYRQWGDFAKFDNEKISNFVSESQEHYMQIAFHYFIQYHLHAQLSEASAYAHEKGIVLKGDVPIGVNKNSVDTWAYPELFNMDKNAGAPPDMFSEKGQNWELPTYNWDVIKASGFDWWKKRFAQMAHYFDTFRIDHILGFFRIWEIPTNQVEGILGHLYPSKAIHINELRERGIYFDYKRFCEPYITEQVLSDFFGDNKSWVKTNCLQDTSELALKALYQNQKNVEQLFEKGMFSEDIKRGLFDLISNVLLFEVENSNGTEFYPRFGMQNLKAFSDLDDHSKSVLNELYVDYFYRRQDLFWYRSGMEKLPALKRASNMLICGEDLGMMTPCVTALMKELGILSLEVQRAPKTNDEEFFRPADAPYLSVVTPSTHDMSSIRGWWEEDRSVSQRFYNKELGHWGDAPYFCEWWICRDIILQHLHSPAMWSIFQLQDLMSISEELRRDNPHDERINVPSNTKYSWRYRMHLNVEELMEKDDFNNELRNYIRQSGR